MTSARPYTAADLPDLLRLIAGNAATRPVGRTGLMTSDVAWQLPGSMPETNIRLWWDGRGLAAYGWYQPPDTLLFDVRTDLEDSSQGAEAVAEITAWAEARRPEFPPGYPFHIDLTSMDEWADAIRHPRAHPLAGNHYVVTSALESDKRRVDLLQQRGYEPTAHFEPILVRALDDLPIQVGSVPFTLRHVEASELTVRVALHAAAWAPASGFNLERYLEIRATPDTFDPELDIVAVAADGTFASYTIAWRDPVSRIGSFEPFGTHPRFRGTGVSELVIGEGLRRLAARGMTAARIYTAGFNHPAARLYRRCGFTDIDRNRTYLKRM
jgi:GNAT superfamily N-acetyltransferase